MKIAFHNKIKPIGHALGLLYLFDDIIWHRKLVIGVKFTKNEVDPARILRRQYLLATVCTFTIRSIMTVISYILFYCVMVYNNLPNNKESHR